MHLPAAVRRRIVYATAATLLVGGLAFGVRPGSKTETPPETSEVKPAVAAEAATPDTATPDTQDSQRIAHHSQAPAAGKAEAPLPAQVEAKAKPKVTTYTVAEGDTVNAVAERFGLKPSTILWSNDLSESDYLQVGQELKIPAVDGAIHTVQSGDSLWGIATEFNVDFTAIAEANPEIDAEALQPGQVLLVPGGEPILTRLSTMVASRGGGERTSSSGTFGRWPVGGSVTDDFGWRTHPVYGTAHYHDGIDLNAPLGTPVATVARGRVSYVGHLGGYGLTIKVDHGNGLVTMYTHLSEASVESGQAVGSGEQVGLSGNTGTSTGPHLHFSVFVDGAPVNPIDWLP